MGRQPRPTALKVLQGVDRSRINDAEPVPSPLGTLDPPVALPAPAQALWDRLAPDMADKKVLTDWDRTALANFCVAQYQADLAAADLEENGTSTTTAVKELRDGTVIYELRKNPSFLVWKDSVALTVTLGSQLGLTPAARSKIRTEPAKPKEKGAERLLS